MNKTIGIMAAALALAAAAAAPSFAAAPLKIGEAVSITLKNNSELRSLRQELIKAEAFKLAADGTLLPSLSVSGAAGWQREPQTNDGSASRRRTTEAATTTAARRRRSNRPSTPAEGTARYARSRRRCAR